MRKIVYFSFLFFIINIPSAYAYIDPGTGSMLLQGLIAGIAAGLTLFSTYYKKIKNFLAIGFFNHKNKKQIADNSTDSTDEKS
ncbi:MAG: hypothetical protein ACD_46C00726G0003 [uncultured bacterium]|nr:MAG: hypothetical protein ACD_46C00726G0003 [uncultured bacterium]